MVLKVAARIQKGKHGKKKDKEDKVEEMRGVSFENPNSEKT